MTHAITLFVGLLTLTLAAPSPSVAAKIAVSSNGIDAIDCGHKQSPCRSISRAILNANDGDTIVVGPGRYGDLNRNGTLAEEGEEFGLGSSAVLVDKPVRIVSTAGAGATTIDGAKEVGYVVFFGDGSSGARLGARKKGFTLVDSDDGGDGVGTDSVTSDITIEGNRAVGHAGEGFEICGSDHRVLGNWALENGQDGIELNGERNAAIGNVSARNVDVGVALYGSRHAVRGNQLTANGLGIDVRDEGIGEMTIDGNVVNGNRGYGIRIDGSGGHRITGNAIIGNGEAGVLFSPSAPSGTAITKNAIYGNDGVGATNCGIDNQSLFTVRAPKNFWGLATGPNLDPADGVCDGPVESAPVLGRDARVRTKTPQ